MRHLSIPTLRRTPRTRNSPPGRRGFTLVELMVAMALSLFLMAILSEAFAVSMDTFRGLRAIGDMQDTLRNGFRQMRDDLAAPHFEGARKMSDANFWTEPRREGFFYMKGSATTTNATTTLGGNVVEGVDANNLPSSRSTDHVLHFAVRRSGYRRTSHFSVGPFYQPNAPLNRYTAQNCPLDSFYGGTDSTNYYYFKSQWGEVAYRLFPMPGTPTPTTPETASLSSPVKLYNLYRAETLMLPYRDKLNLADISGMVTGEGTLAGQLYVYKISNDFTNLLSPNDVANSTTRGIKPAAASERTNPTAAQTSLLCTNVVSFQVRLLVQQRTVSTQVDPNYPDPNPAKDPVKSIVALDDMKNYFSATNPSDPAIDSAALTTPTWAAPAAATGPGLRILGLQIRLRIYDPATGLTRQNTLVQAL